MSMGEAKRKQMRDQGYEVTGSDADILGKMVEHVRENADDLNVVIGPAAWQPSDGTTSKVWYFIVATSEKGRGFRCDQIVIADSMGDPDETRRGFIAALVRHRPLVIHDTDDELYMARLCETLWPGERITGIRKSIERERGAKGC